jgi:hypothetical protein
MPPAILKVSGSVVFDFSPKVTAGRTPANDLIQG